MCFRTPTLVSSEKVQEATQQKAEGRPAVELSTILHKDENWNSADKMLSVWKKDVWIHGNDNSIKLELATILADFFNILRWKDV